MLGSFLLYIQLQVPLLNIGVSKHKTRRRRMEQPQTTGKNLKATKMMPTWEMEMEMVKMTKKDLGSWVMEFVFMLFNQVILIFLHFLDVPF